MSNAELPPLPGDKLLVLWWKRVRGEYSPPKTHRYVSAFNLSHPERAQWEPALTTAFGVIREPDSILAAVTRRVTMIRAGRPLGDDRRLSLLDFASGKGSIEAWMPEASDAEKATYGGSINLLVYPADADQLPALMKATRDERPEMRAWAATTLAQFPCDSVVARLEQMLRDDGLAPSLHSKSKGAVDSVWTAVVRNAAQESLKTLRVHHTE